MWKDLVLEFKIELLNTGSYGAPEMQNQCLKIFVYWEAFVYTYVQQYSKGKLEISNESNVTENDSM